jgi:hypothetical protein
MYVLEQPTLQTLDSETSYALIANFHGSPHRYAQVRVQHKGTACTSCWLRMGSVVTLSSSDGKDFLLTRQPMRLCCIPSLSPVYDPPSGSPLGWFRLLCTSCFTQVDLPGMEYHIQQSTEVDASSQGPVFSILLRGKEVGFIRKKIPSMLRKHATGPDNFCIHFPGDSTPQEKAVLLGSLFSFIVHRYDG